MNTQILRNRIILTAAALTVAAIAAAVADMPFGVPGQWVVGGLSDPSWTGLIFALPGLALMLLLIGAVLPKIHDASRRDRIVSVAMLIVFAFAMQFAVGSLGKAGNQEAFVALVTPTTNQYFEESANIDDPIEYLRGYQARAAEAPGWQLKTHPPGPVMFFYGVRQVVRRCPTIAQTTLGMAEHFIQEHRRWRNIPEFAPLSENISPADEAAGWISLALLRFAAALTVVPIYLLGKMRYGTRTGWTAAGLTALIPSLLLFNPLIDQLYPPIGATALLLGFVAVRKGMASNLIVGGVLYIGMMFSVSFLMFLALVVALQAWLIITGSPDTPPRSLVTRLQLVNRFTMVLLMGVLGPMVIVSVLTGMPGLILWIQCVRANAAFNAVEGRTYLPWLLMNPLMFAMFLGIPAAVLFARRIILHVRQSVQSLDVKQIDPLLLFSVVLLAGLWLWGANLGEVERLWMPLMPICAMLGMSARPTERGAVLVLVGLQGVQAIAFKLALDPLNLFNLL